MYVFYSKPIGVTLRDTDKSWLFRSQWSRGSKKYWQRPTFVVVGGLGNGTHVATGHEARAFEGELNWILYNDRRAAS